MMWLILSVYFQILKTLPVLQKQIDALLDFDVSTISAVIDYTLYNAMHLPLHY